VRVTTAYRAGLLIVALIAPTLDAQAHTTWTVNPTTFALSVKWDSNIVTGNRQMAATIQHSDPTSPCSRIYQVAITDSAHAPAGAALKWLPIAGGSCDFGPAGVSTGQFYALYSGEFVERCRGKNGPLSLRRKIWLSLFSNASPSEADTRQQLTQGPSYPFIANVDGYKETELTVNMTCIAPPPPPPPPPPKLTITGVTMAPATFTGACPANVNFTGKVSVNITGGVQTRFEFSDGVSSPTALWHANAPGMTATYTRTFKTSTTGFVRLHAGALVTDNTPYTVTCK
jgi:hypothetical protein